MTCELKPTEKHNDNHNTGRGLKSLLLASLVKKHLASVPTPGALLVYIVVP